EDPDVDAAGPHGVLADVRGRSVVGGEELHVAGIEAGAEGGVLGGLDETTPLGEAGKGAGVTEEDLGGSHGDVSGPADERVCKAPADRRVYLSTVPPRSVSGEGARGRAIV